jgi:hypothetical protein
MSAWTEDEISRLRRRFVGSEEDFGKVLACVQIIRTVADLEKLEGSGRLVAWDPYFKREKVILGVSKEAPRQ